MPHDSYISPFSTRYASKEMQFIFSEDNKFALGGSCGLRWRRRKRNRGWTLLTSRLPSWKLTRTTSTTTMRSAARRSAATM